MTNRLVAGVPYMEVHYLNYFSDHCTISVQYTECPILPRFNDESDLFGTQPSDGTTGVLFALPSRFMWDSKKRHSISLHTNNSLQNDLKNIFGQDLRG